MSYYILLLHEFVCYMPNRYVIISNKIYSKVVPHVRTADIH